MVAIICLHWCHLTAHQITQQLMISTTLIPITLFGWQASFSNRGMVIQTNPTSGQRPFPALSRMSGLFL